MSSSTAVCLSVFSYGFFQTAEADMIFFSEFHSTADTHRDEFLKIIWTVGGVKTKPTLVSILVSPVDFVAQVVDWPTVGSTGPYCMVHTGFHFYSHPTHQPMQGSWFTFSFQVSGPDFWSSAHIFCSIAHRQSDPIPFMSSRGLFFQTRAQQGD